MKAEVTPRNILVVARGILVDDNDKVLLVKRAKNRFYHPGDWELPGGKLTGLYNLQDEIEISINRETGLVVRADVQNTYTQSRVVTEGGKYNGYMYIETTTPAEFIAGRVTLGQGHSEFLWVDKDGAFDLELTYESKKALSNYYYLLKKDLKHVMVTLVARALIKKNNKYLLIRRATQEDAGGKWELPGGKINAFENPENLLKREVFEETNLLINVEKNNIYTSSIIETQGNNKGRTYVTIFSLASIRGGDINLSHEHDKYEWFTEKEIKQLYLAHNLLLALTEVFLRPKV